MRLNLEHASNYACLHKYNTTGQLTLITGCTDHMRGRIGYMRGRISYMRGRISYMRGRIGYMRGRISYMSRCLVQLGGEQKCEHFFL